MKGNTMTDFQREDRCFVLKMSDIKKHLTPADRDRLMLIEGKLAARREADGKPSLECAVVEKDWPEFEPVWAMIEARMTGKPNAEEQLKIELGRAYRCIQGMHNALTNGGQFAEIYHLLTIGAAKRFVFENDLSGSQYFEGKHVSVLHEALCLPAGMKEQG